jgi:hypothetical protein
LPSAPKPQKAYKTLPRPRYKRPFLDPAVDTSLTKGSGDTAKTPLFFRHLQDFLKWRDPDSNRGHHDFQSYAEAFRYAVNPYK